MSSSVTVPSKENIESTVLDRDEAMRIVSSESNINRVKQFKNGDIRFMPYWERRNKGISFCCLSVPSLSAGASGGSRRSAVD